MNLIEKVASYYNTYKVSNADESLLKTASVDGIGKDDLIAFHNLTEANMFTGENLIELQKEAEESESKIIQLGFTIDKVINGELPEDEIQKTASALGMDEEDVGFITAHIQRQMEEAGIVEKTASYLDAELIDKVASAAQLLIENNIDPIEAFTVAANTDEEGYPVDEKTAYAMNQYADAELDKIAEAVDMVGGAITPEVAETLLSLLED